MIIRADIKLQGVIGGGAGRKGARTALITHGHADHAHGAYRTTIATPETHAIMKLYCAVNEGGQKDALRALGQD